ncbi:hypothetical protein HFU84_10725 [Acidithiobacillus sp. CV18-2]|nr:hypothetical protein [Igneacidithiobacillus copahuensis]MBU2754811.1 hypothetical protein [Acidithiobacillus sp. CV18-3]MBU2757476.1 hypothetical protein [Acidithiobacillus sp. BN09-2]MBU2777970.1 hypothetical protein [Acidithiobacillus sp. CV18-2]MBU2796311.1 hypothetical protein [Acidithiobacillus sp. VAN18-2]MBU2800065.1 hypothetical protein [Acidithiobacillus sp. VAN18-4]UTV81150.1 hypothetical protein MQE22_00605 [Acidithiobacillus sp. YTS05]
MMSTDANSKASWMAVIIVILAIIVLVGFFFLWLHPAGPAPVAKTASSATALQSVSPTGSVVSVPDFVVAPGISQQGTIEGAIEGRCGNIAWQKLDPKELQELRKLCPRQAASAQGQGEAHP